MKKKILSLLVVICFVFSGVFLLTACGDDPIYKATLESEELYFGSSAVDKDILSNRNSEALRGPAYYDYSEIKLLVNGQEVEGFFTPQQIDYNSNYVYIGTVNPKKLTADATITVTGVKDRLARFTYMDFEDTKEYKDLKETYEGYLNDYQINNAKANDTSYSEDERNLARTNANRAEGNIRTHFNGVMTGFNSWYATKKAFANAYELKLSEQDKIALTTAPLKDKIITGTTTYEDVVSEDGYIGLNYISKIKKDNQAYRFTYTFKELTTKDDLGFCMGMLPIRSVLPLGRDTAATHNNSGSGYNKTLQFNKLSDVSVEDEEPLYGKEEEYSRDLVLSVDMYSYAIQYHVELGDDYANKLYLRIGDLNNYTINYAIDPTAVEYSEFKLEIANQSFNGFAKIKKNGFVVKGFGNQTYSLDKLGNIYFFTNENNEKSVMTDKVVINRITAGPGEVAYYYGVILFEGNNARLDVDWASYMYYDYEQNIITSLGEPDRTDNANLVQVKSSMVEDITDEANVLVTEDDIEYYYGAISYAGGTESFEASSNTYTFDLLLDSGHNIDWTNVKVMIGGKADNTGVNLVELTGEYGTYEIKDYLFESSLGIGLNNVKVLHCTINLFNGNKDYYPISFVNKEDLSGSFGVTKEAFTTYYIKLEGVDFSEATGMVKVKGTSNVNPEAFAYYQNSSMMVYDNKDGSAYMVVDNSSVYNTEIAGPHFAVLGQNLSNFSLTSGYYAASNLSAMTIEVKKNGDVISTIGVKDNLLEENRYGAGNEMVMMFGGGNGGYYFAKTEGEYKFYVFVNTEQTFDGQLNDNVEYISSVVIVVEDISGNNPSTNLTGFFEFELNMER